VGSATSTEEVAEPPEEAREFWDGCRRGRLRLQHCPRCGNWQYYPRYACTSCGRRDPDWEDASGAATVWSYSVVERGFAHFVDRTPYVVALVKLAEGPVMMTNIVDCDPGEVELDMPVEVVCRKDEATGVTLPYFRPAGDGDG